ncbi:Mitochondrial import inner membrane translocase subunit Tim8 A [Gracilariopsis chorda]|uniref:Mitochondrial import inner membrane translocase subunit n=1 Tax=Gracilariopsis chorda TaxID=448386 RepID=A0A2V3IDF2_9FLOR|nr:Mitochondrial import inner membrane translocase subunit Tim8 A [Gracilariopsis chorda]|eukprot:PXF40104.1 Mitochondrial import inner membrane translocase subunit Tim8 A [Gracilariopsis chorda]
MNSSTDPQTTAAMQAFIQEENQKAAVQQIISKLTDTCWDKCMGKPGNKLSSWETDCISNCAERFLDTSIFIVQRMEKQAQSRNGI